MSGKYFLVSMGWNAWHSKDAMEILEELEAGYQWHDLRESLPRDPHADRTLPVGDSVIRQDGFPGMVEGLSVQLEEIGNVYRLPSSLPPLTLHASQM